MVRAQETYKAMLRDHLAPQLRAQGFKGSGNAYEMPSPSHWIILGVQASQYSTGDEVRFTLNCQVVRRDVWDDARRDRGSLGPKPKPNSFAGSFVWRSRIGKLLPESEDKWWSLRASDDPEPLAHEVAVAVREHVIPAIREAVESE